MRLGIMIVMVAAALLLAGCDNPMSGAYAKRGKLETVLEKEHFKNFGYPVTVTCVETGSNGSAWKCLGDGGTDTASGTQQQVSFDVVCDAKHCQWTEYGG